MLEQRLPFTIHNSVTLTLRSLSKIRETALELLMMTKTPRI